MITILIALVIIAALLSIMAVAFAQAGWRRVKHLRENRDTLHNERDELRDRLCEAKELLREAETARQRSQEYKDVLADIYKRLDEFEAKDVEP